MKDMKSIDSEIVDFIDIMISKCERDEVYYDFSLVDDTGNPIKCQYVLRIRESSDNDFFSEKLNIGFDFMGEVTMYVILRDNTLNDNIVHVKPPKFKEEIENRIQVLYDRDKEDSFKSILKSASDMFNIDKMDYRAINLKKLMDDI